MVTKMQYVKVYRRTSPKRGNDFTHLHNWLYPMLYSRLDSYETNVFICFIVQESRGRFIREDDLKKLLPLILKEL